MDIKLGRLALLLVIAHAVPQVLVAQSSHDTAMVQAGALRFARAKVAGHGPIAVDTTARFAAAAAASVPTLRAAATAASISARVGKTSDFVRCQTPQAYKTCVLNGVDAIVGLASAYFRGDSAYVRLRLSEGQNARHQISEKVYVVRFVRTGTIWKYVGANLTSQS